MNIHPGLIAFARFCAEKSYYFRVYIHVHPEVIAFLHGFALKNAITPVPTSM